MTREQLLEECFGRSDFPPPNRTVELTEGRDVVSHLDIYLRRLHLRYDGDFAVEGRGVDAATTLAVATIENVCTDPGRRGQGYASAMVRRALSELEENRPISFVVVRLAPVPVEAPPEESRLYGFFGRFGFAQASGYPGFLVAKLREEPWPRGRIRLLGEWPDPA